MKQTVFTIRSQENLAQNIFRMILEGDTSAITAPGQFINIRLEGRFLRRPISVCDYTASAITIIYKVVGDGTAQMRDMQAGDKLDILTGLGNGYDLTKSGDTPLLVGGGVGVPPLYHLCRRLVEQGKHPTVVLGFNTAADVFYEKEFQALGAAVVVTTADGSYGRRGFVTDVLPELEYSYFYACGPEAMFRAMERVVQGSGQYSFEERMGCGFGACMGCSCRTLTGNKRICKEGPVLERKEILWEN